MEPKRMVWSIVVTRDLDGALQEAVKRNGHVSKSDFVRDVVRQRIREKGIEC